MNVGHFVDLCMFIYLLEDDVWYDAEENPSEERYGSNGQDCFLRFSDMIGVRADSSNVLKLILTLSESMRPTEQ